MEVSAWACKLVGEVMDQQAVLVVKKLLLRTF